jgi:hypothetical protein
VLSTVTHWQEPKPAFAVYAVVFLLQFLLALQALGPGTGRTMAAHQAQQQQAQAAQQLLSSPLQAGRPPGAPPCPPARRTTCC